MDKGKIYNLTNMITREVIENGMYASDMVDLLDEAKGEIPKMKHIPPFVIQSGKLSKAQAKALDEYLRADFAWKHKWFGDGKYTE